MSDKVEDDGTPDQVLLTTRVEYVRNVSAMILSAELPRSYARFAKSQARAQKFAKSRGQEWEESAFDCESDIAYAINTAVMLANRLSAKGFGERVLVTGKRAVSEAER